MGEIAFEKFMVGLETVARGTSAAAPTHIANLQGQMRPEFVTWRPEEQTGVLEQFSRSLRTREWSSWTASGGLDNYLLPVFLNMLAKGNVTAGSAVGTSANTYLWDFKDPDMTADTIETGTFWFGDPNVELWKAVFGTVDELTVTGNASGTDGVTMELSGMANTMEDGGAPADPTRLTAPLFPASWMQFWLDQQGGGGIGTTEITGRVISASVTVPGGLSYKYFAVGPGGAKTYSKIGRGKRQAVLTVEMEIPDTTQFALFQSEALVDARVRYNGSFIENDGGTDLYHYVEFDVYGPLEFEDWGELEATNRTVSFRIASEYNTAAATGWGAAVQNDRSTL